MPLTKQAVLAVHLGPSGFPKTVILAVADIPTHTSCVPTVPALEESTILHRSQL